MEQNVNKWGAGDIVTLPRTERLLKKSGTTTYKSYVASRFLCIKEPTEGHRGILVKVLGKMFGEHIIHVNGKVFCKDDCDELFSGKTYLGYPFPSEQDVKEVLDILHKDQSLLKQLQDASMHFNPESTIWVSETKRNKLLKKKSQFFDAKSGELCVDDGNRAHYRLTVVYFDEEELDW